MTRYLLKRIASLLPTALGVASIVFLLLHVMPGDPVDVMLGESAAPAQRQALRQALGLQRPLQEQYTAFLADLARGDMGTSIRDGRPVLALVKQRFPATLVLASSAVIIALMLALPLGMVAAANPRGWIDRVSLLVALLAVAIPNFWLGPLLMLTFAVTLGWLPVSGSGSVAHLVLPAVTLGASMAGILTRMTRSALLEVLHEDFTRTARAKGCSAGRTLAVHALPCAATPLLSLIGLQFGALLGGAVVTETIFAWPGLGRLTMEAIHARDYPVVQGCVLTIAITTVIVNLITDLAYTWFNPRIRYAPRS